MTRLQYIAELLLKALASPDHGELSPSHGVATHLRKATRAAKKKRAK